MELKPLAAASGGIYVHGRRLDARAILPNLTSA